MTIQPQQMPAGTDADDTGFNNAFSEFAATGGNGADATVTSSPVADANQQVSAGVEEHAQENTPENGNKSIDAGHETSSALDWASVPPEFRAAFEAARKDADAGQQYRRSNEGRVTAFQSKIARLNDELAALRAANGSASQTVSQPISNAQLSDVNAVVKDFPELAPLAKVVEGIAAHQQRANDRFARMDQQQQEAALHSNAAELTKLHPDWQQVTASSEFAQWFQDSPDFIQQVLRQNGDGIRDVNSAAYVVGLFKSQTQPPAAAPSQNNTAILRSAQQSGAVSVSSNNRGGASGPPNDYDGAFAHFAARAS